MIQIITNSVLFPFFGRKISTRCAKIIFATHFIICNIYILFFSFSPRVRTILSIALLRPHEISDHVSVTQRFILYSKLPYIEYYYSAILEVLYCFTYNQIETSIIVSFCCFSFYLFAYSFFRFTLPLCITCLQ